MQSLQKSPLQTLPQETTGTCSPLKPRKRDAGNRRSNQEKSQKHFLEDDGGRPQRAAGSDWSSQYHALSCYSTLFAWQCALSKQGTKEKAVRSRTQRPQTQEKDQGNSKDGSKKKSQGNNWMASLGNNSKSRLEVSGGLKEWQLQEN